MKKTGILFVYSGAHFALPPWMVCEQIIQNLDRERFEVFVAADPTAEGEAHLGAPGATLLPRIPMRSPAELVRSLPALRAVVRRHPIDVVHANEDRPTALAGLAISRLCGLPLVLHYHAVPSIYRGARRALLLGAAALAKRNVGVSDFLERELAAAGIRRTAAVRNGVDPVRFRPENDGSAVRAELGFAPDEVVVLEIARFWRPKRQEDLVRAIARARVHDPRIVGLLVGWDDPHYDGPFAGYREEVQRLAASLGVDGKVVLTRARPDSPAIHAAADIFGFPSIDEPFGLVVAEALATGKPVVAARSGGVPEIVEDGVSGFLVEPRDPAAMAEKLVLLARDPSLRERMGRAGRESAVRRFAPAAVARQFEAIYESAARDPQIVHRGHP
jgi:D-inositol-3-phosphate glycosyltransferase